MDAEVTKNNKKRNKNKKEHKKRDEKEKKKREKKSEMEVGRSTWESVRRDHVAPERIPRLRYL